MRRLASLFATAPPTVGRGGSEVDLLHVLVCLMALRSKRPVAKAYFHPRQLRVHVRVAVCASMLAGSVAGGMGACRPGNEHPWDRVTTLLQEHLATSSPDSANPEPLPRYSQPPHAASHPPPLCCPALAPGLGRLRHCRPGAAHGRRRGRAGGLLRQLPQARQAAAPRGGAGGHAGAHGGGRVRGSRARTRH